MNRKGEQPSCVCFWVFGGEVKNVGLACLRGLEDLDVFWVSLVIFSRRISHNMSFATRKIAKAP